MTQQKVELTEERVREIAAEEARKILAEYAYRTAELMKQFRQATNVR